MKSGVHMLHGFFQTWGRNQEYLWGFWREFDCASCQQKYCSEIRNQRWVFWIRVGFCAFFVRVEVRVRVRVCLMHVCSKSRVRVMVRVLLYTYNWLHVMKRYEQIRYRVLLILYIYMCACEYVCMCVQIHRCVYIWWIFFIGEFVRICVCMWVSVNVCLIS